MRKVVGLIGLLLILSAPMLAQDIPAFEIFGGYSYLRADVSGVNQAYKGWNLGVNENVNRWFGGMLDISGHYGQPGGVNANIYSFLYGPVFSFRKLGGFTPSGHAMIGAVRGSKAYLGLSESKFEFGAAVGGALDVKLGNRVALRIVQGDFILTPFFGLRQNNLRVSSGLIFYLGKK